jgi:site-specific recombinase XerD
VHIYKEEIDLYFELKGTPSSTREAYSRRIGTFINYLQKRDKRVEDATISDVQQFLLHLKNETGISPGTINGYHSAVKFFCAYVLKLEWNTKSIPRMKRKASIPVIPSRKTLQLLLDAVWNIKHKAIIAIMYGSGLRIGEAVKLKIKDISSENMTIRVDNAKHGTNRYAILSVTALDLLRKYFKAYLSGTGYTGDDWLFRGHNPDKHLTVKSIQNMLLKLRKRLGFEEQLTSHLLRHSFATHALEDGVDPVFIQQLLGHRHLSTTLVYLHMTSKSLMGIKSPLDTHNQKTP